MLKPRTLTTICGPLHHARRGRRDLPRHPDLISLRPVVQHSALGGASPTCIAGPAEIRCLLGMFLDDDSASSKKKGRTAQGFSYTRLQK